MLLVFVLQSVCFSSSRVYLLNEWKKNSILLVTSNGTRVLIGAEIEAEKLAKAVLKTGSTQLDALFINQNIDKQIKEAEELKKYIGVKGSARAEVYELSIQGTHP